MPLLKISDQKIMEIPAIEKLLEKQVEDILAESKLKSLYGDELLVVGRQVHTSTNKILDILAIDRNGQLIVVELKKGAAPRDTIAQIIDYASWLNSLAEKDIEKIFKGNNDNKSLVDEFRRMYDADLNSIGDDIVLFLFARSFPDEVRNAADYLSERGVSISCMEYDIFGEQDREMFLYTKGIAGDEGEMQAEGGSVKEISPHKREDRRFFKNLAKSLEDKYGDWLSGFRYERIDRFQTFQEKQGYYTSTYNDFRYDNSKFVIEIGIERYEDNMKLLFALWCRRVSEKFENLIQGQNIQELALSISMKVIQNDDWHGHLKAEFNGSFCDGKIDEEKTMDFLLDQFERAKPVIEAILTQ